MLKGIQEIAPVAGMFVFAILYFGVMTDAGLIEPVIQWLLRMLGGRPARIVVGSAFSVPSLVHLDGSGAVTFLVTIPVMLPLYDKLSMDRRVLACACALAAGVNFLPWTGPVLRASAALHIPVSDLFRDRWPPRELGCWMSSPSRGSWGDEKSEGWPGLNVWTRRRLPQRRLLGFRGVHGLTALSLF